MADSLNGDYEQARKMLQRSAYETPIGRSPLSAYIYMRKSISFFRVSRHADARALPTRLGTSALKRLSFLCSLRLSCAHLSLRFSAVCVVFYV